MIVRSPPSDWSYPAFPHAYGVMLCLAVRRYGGNPDAVLAGTGVSEATMRSDRRYLPFEILRRLTLVLQAGRPSPTLGLEIGADAPISAHGPITTATIASPTLGHAVDLVARYAFARSQALDFVILENERSTSLVVRERFDFGDVRETILQAVLIMLERLLAAVVGSPRLGAVYHFPFPDRGGAAIRAALLEGEARFAARHLALEFSPELLALPALMPDEMVYAAARRHCDFELAEALGDRRDNLLALLRRRLSSAGDGFPTLEALAAEIGISPRTLIRRLRALGTTYQGLRDQSRRDLAEWYLRHSDLSVERVAERLGYVDTSNFSRSFRRWTGITPRDYRAVRPALGYPAEFG